MYIYLYMTMFYIPYTFAYIISVIIHAPHIIYYEQRNREMAHRGNKLN